MAFRRLGYVLLLILVVLLWPGAAAADDAALGTLPTSQLQVILYMLSWLLPLGIALVAVGLSVPARAQQVATSLPLALAIAVSGYYLCGFAFHFGGIELVLRAPGLSAFVAEWSPLDLYLGPGWGLLGLRGFALPSEMMTDTALQLYLSQLPLVTTAVLIPLLSLNGRLPRLPSLFLALVVSCVAYPLMGNWVRGGGWLSQLGNTLGLGHGFVDYGLGSTHLVGGCAALAGLVAFRRKMVEPTSAPTLPASYLPLNILIGAFLVLIGWFVIILSQPLVPVLPSAAALMLNALLAVSGSCLAALLYGWLVRGEFDAGLVGRSIIAALVATSAGLAFIPSWAALLVGFLSGLFLAPAMYVVDQVFRLQDSGAVVSVHGLSALWGVLAVGLLGDGRTGQTWNAVQGALSLGVTGYLGGSSDQIAAQAIGAAALIVLALLLPLCVMGILAWAYDLPPSVRAAARARAEQLRQEAQARQSLLLRGLRLNFWQKLRIHYLHSTTTAERRQARRPRLARPSMHPRSSRR